MTFLTNGCVEDLTQDVWAALLAGHPPLVPGDPHDGDLLAAVDITGEWNGTVGLSCSHLAARHLTAAIFGIEDGEIGDDDIVDALGEMANVVGGNLKSLVPGPSVLSLPRLDDGRAHHHYRSELALEVSFRWMAEPVMVRVWTDDEI